MKTKYIRKNTFHFLTFLKMSEFGILKKDLEFSYKIHCCDCHGLIFKNIFEKVENIEKQKGSDIFPKGAIFRQ